jgi:hypothetical protein
LGIIDACAPTVKKALGVLMLTLCGSIVYCRDKLDVSLVDVWRWVEDASCHGFLLVLMWVQLLHWVAGVARGMLGYFSANL